MEHVFARLVLPVGVEEDEVHARGEVWHQDQALEAVGVVVVVVTLDLPPSGAVAGPGVEDGVEGGAEGVNGHRGNYWAMTADAGSNMAGPVIFNRVRPTLEA